MNYNKKKESRIMLSVMTVGFTFTGILALLMFGTVTVLSPFAIAMVIFAQFIGICVFVADRLFPDENENIE